MLKKSRLAILVLFVLAASIAAAIPPPPPPPDFGFGSSPSNSSLNITAQDNSSSGQSNQTSSQTQENASDSGANAPTEDNADQDSVAQPSCSDSIRNQGETGVDCGGPCSPCANEEATGDEGSQNNADASETPGGTDQGGGTSAPPNDEGLNNPPQDTEAISQRDSSPPDSGAAGPGTSQLVGGAAEPSQDNADSAFYEEEPSPQQGFSPLVWLLVLIVPLALIGAASYLFIRREMNAKHSDFSLPADAVNGSGEAKSETSQPSEQPSQPTSALPDQGAANSQFQGAQATAAQNQQSETSQHPSGTAASPGWAAQAQPRSQGSNAQLANYLSFWLRRGYLYEAIKNVLVSKGWRGEDVDRAYQLLVSRASASHASQQQAGTPPDKR